MTEVDTEVDEGTKKNRFTELTINYRADGGLGKERGRASRNLGKDVSNRTSMGPFPDTGV